MTHPLKAATPAVVVDVQPEKVPSPVPIAKVMGLLSLGDRIAPGVLDGHGGLGAEGLPAVASPGSMVKTSWPGVPNVTSNA